MMSVKRLVTFGFLLILILPGNDGFAQEKPSYSPAYTISQSALVSSGTEQPFWTTANQQGIYSRPGSAYLLTQARFRRSFLSVKSTKWDYTYGARLVLGEGKSTDMQLNEFWIGARYRSLLFKLGAESDPVRFGGLSSTNGNMYQSGNARPVPGLSIATDGFVPLGWITWKFRYDEGLLTDHQAIEKAHLHHKELYFKSLISSSMSLTIGVEHYVFWGGTSSIYGPLPGMSEYLHYVLGIKGGKGVPVNDQLNAAGNGLGRYCLELTKSWSGFEATFYWNHPFEDRSGMEMANIQDGLWGIHLGKAKKEGWLTDVDYEFMCTMNQSGTYNMVPAPTPQNPNRRIGRGDDKYFNHFIYSSGFTYFQHMMGSPLFVPTIGTNGVSQGFESTRMLMHHLGISGMINPQISWRTLWTYSLNFGEYDTPYKEPLHEISILAETVYQPQHSPLSMKAGLARDLGNRFERRSGAYIGVALKF